MGVAEPARRDALDERVLGLVHEDRQRRFEDRDVDPLADPVRRRALALAPGERGEDPDGRVEPGRDVGDRDADLRRVTAVGVGRAGDRHQPGLGLEQEVVARPADERPGRAVAADREMDEARVERGEDVVPEPEPGEAVRSEVLDEDVGVGEESAQHVGAGGLLQVEPEAALVAVDREVVGGGPASRRSSLAHPRRAPAAGRVALGRLDLDDVGAEVGQEHRRVRPGEDRRAVDDADARERTGRLAGHSPMVAAASGRRIVRS